MDGIRERRAACEIEYAEVLKAEREGARREAREQMARALRTQATLALSRLRVAPGDLVLARCRDREGVSEDALAAMQNAAERAGASFLALVGLDLDFRAIPAAVIADLPGVCDEAEWGELLRRIEEERSGDGAVGDG